VSTIRVTLGRSLSPPPPPPLPLALLLLLLLLLRYAGRPAGACALK